MMANNLGRLKIFLGMSAGVGKTYTMLKEAQSQARRGVGVLIAWLEPHARPETNEQANGLPSIPSRVVEYRGIKANEMDLEAVLAAKPGLALVDELAHSNTPGLRHPKRWQDIFDLLDAGIDVYTTVNIQHLESLADVVEEFSGVGVRERVPDMVFDRAENIQVVDISPQDLLLRLKEGKIYTGDSTRQAIENFFRTENLTALRELALDQAAKTAGQQLQWLLRADESTGGSLSQQTILVAVSPSPNSEYLLRWTRRLALRLRSEWTCLYVENGRPMRDADKDRLIKHLTLARNLGAHVVTMINDDVVNAIIGYARHNSFQTLVVGKSGISRPRIWGRNMTITDRLIRESGQIEIIAVQERANQESVTQKAARRIKANQVPQFVLALATVAIATGVNLLLEPAFGYFSASILYLTAISLLGLAVNRGAVMAAAVVSALLWDALFIPPRFTLFISRTEDLFILFLFFILALTSGWATSRLRWNSRILELRERRMNAMSNLTQAMATVAGIREVALAGLDFVTAAFDAEAFVQLRDQTGKLTREKLIGFPVALNERDLSAIEYCYAHGQPTGRFTETLPGIGFHFLPLAAAGGTIGIMGLQFKGKTPLTDDQRGFLLTMCRTISMALEREFLAEENRRNLLLQESERLSTLLVHSISHELRTPLTVIKGSASALKDPETGADPIVRKQLLESILLGSESLNEIIENLLSINRLESGNVRLDLQDIEAAELVETALAKSVGFLADRPIKVIPALPGLSVRCDEVLTLQVIRNILQNIDRYTPRQSPVEVIIALREAEGQVRFSFADHGPGIGEQDLGNLFGKFWRGDSRNRAGTGLGLAICKGLVEIQKGAIGAKNREGGGLELYFSLPQSETEDEKRSGN